MNMTREEAITILQDKYDCCKSFYQLRRKTPAFRHGDISRTLFSRFSCIRYLPVV